MLDVLVLVLLVVLFCWWRPWQHRAPSPSAVRPEDSAIVRALLEEAKRQNASGENQIRELSADLASAQRELAALRRRIYDLQKWACEIRVGFGRLLVEHHRNPVPMMENGMCRFCTSEEWAKVVGQLRLE